MSKVDVFRKVMRTRRRPRIGRCPICGHHTAFLWIDSNPREGLTCPFCHSSARHRLVARQLLDRWQGQSLARLNSLPEDLFVADVHGPLAAALGRFSARVARSEFVPDSALGTALPGGGTCQDLEQLTYADRSFDVVVTEDVLEHVRRPRRVFDEIHRVLRPGGAHIFTVPFRFDRPTLNRVDTTGTTDVMLMEPEWHGDSIRGRILAYRTFGYDMFDELRVAGFETSVRFATLKDQREGIFDASTFVSVRLH